ncbi:MULTISPECIES: hypothetical protein [unclassified Psychrobacter]|uniref:hypothetical protein n=1 Tax=unclassified Psychrobacter TaxID=196806 RepID=UPI0018F2B5FD|nr:MULTISPECIES: hypothetical protein [unclassified Psychrobacter]
MIETKVLSDAPGIQNQGLIDKTESTSLPAMTNGVIVGRFKRGRMDKAMVVTANNYQAVLGHDPSNPSYLAVEDVFALGVNQVSVLRTGSSTNASEDFICTASNLEFIQDFVPSANLTVSINDQEKITVQTPSFDASQAEFHQYQLRFINLMTAGDGNSIAFVSAFFTNLNVSPPEVIQQGQAAVQFSGISSNGEIEVYGTTHNITDLIVDAASDGVNAERYEIASIKREKTTVKIYPTVGVSKEMDDYYRFPGASDNGDPIVITSCARAVLGDVVQIS